MALAQTILFALEVADGYLHILARPHTQCRSSASGICAARLPGTRCTADRTAHSA